MMVAITDAYADTWNINMDLRDGGRSQDESRCTGDAQN
jgi:hypothetical protein